MTDRSIMTGWLLMPLEAIQKHGVATYEDWPMDSAKKIHGDVDKTFELVAGRIELATRGSACFDLFSTVDLVFQPGQTIAIPTGVFTKFTPNLRAIIKERSGLALKSDFHVHGGVIDSDYRDEWKVIAQFAPLYTYDGLALGIKAGDKIAQFKLEVIPLVTLIGDGIIIKDAERQGGFGSTGK